MNEDVSPYKCLCEKDGFILASEGNCQDVDECQFDVSNTKLSENLIANVTIANVTNVCENKPNSKCVNTFGDFKCVCKDGFEAKIGRRVCLLYTYIHTYIGDFVYYCCYC